MFLRDCWYAAGFGEEAGRDFLIGRMLEEEAAAAEAKRQAATPAKFDRVALGAR